MALANVSAAKAPMVTYRRRVLSAPTSTNRISGIMASVRTTIAREGMIKIVATGRLRRHATTNKMAGEARPTAQKTIREIIQVCIFSHSAN